MSPAHLLVGGPSGRAAAMGAGSVDTRGPSPAVGRPAAPRPVPSLCPPTAGRVPVPLISGVLWQDRRFKGGSTDAWFLVRKQWFSLVFVDVTCLFSCDFLFGRQDSSAVCAVWPSTWRFWGPPRRPPLAPLPPPLESPGCGNKAAGPAPCVCLCVSARMASLDCPRGHCSPIVWAAMRPVPTSFSLCPVCPLFSLLC